MDENVLNLMELTNLPIEDSKRYLADAGGNLELAIQNFYDSQNDVEFVSPQVERPTQPPPPIAQPFIEEGEDVRPVLPRSYSQLIEQESTRTVQLSRVMRQFCSGFRDFKRETILQEEISSGAAAPKRKCLEDLYRNPIEITFNIDLHSAKNYGSKNGRWVAIVINDESFPSFCLNRDIFNEPSQRVKQLLKKNFIFLRKRYDDVEGNKILQNYNLLQHSIPVFLVIDSLTGELRKNFGDTRNLALKDVVRELKKYTATIDKQLKYTSSFEDSGDDETESYSGLIPSSSSNSKSASTATTASTSQKQPSQPVKAQESDEESFASINSDDAQSDNDNEEAKVLEPDDDEQLAQCETQTNIMLKLNESNHNFKYPSKRTVRQLINYIYNNYLIQTGIYDNQINRFILFSKIHSKCITNLVQDLTLEESKIHPSCVLLHNTAARD